MNPLTSNLDQENKRVLSSDEFSADDLVVRPDPEINDLIPFFLDNRNKELTGLRQSLEGGKFDEIRRLAHTWKGICRPYGFLHLEQLSRELECAAINEDTIQVNRVLDRIEKFLKNVQIVLEKA